MSSYDARNAASCKASKRCRRRPPLVLVLLAVFLTTSVVMADRERTHPRPLRRGLRSRRRSSGMMNPDRGLMAEASTFGVLEGQPAIHDFSQATFIGGDVQQPTLSAFPLAHDSTVLFLHVYKVSKTRSCPGFASPILGTIFRSATLCYARSTGTTTLSGFTWSGNYSDLFYHPARVTYPAHLKLYNRPVLPFQRTLPTKFPPHGSFMLDTIARFSGRSKCHRASCPQPLRCSSALLGIVGSPSGEKPRQSPHAYDRASS